MKITAPLLGYLENPLETSELVLVAGGGRLAKKLTDGVKAAGGVSVNTSPPNRARDRQTWVRAEAELHGVRLDGAAGHRQSAGSEDNKNTRDEVGAVHFFFFPSPLARKR